MYLQYTSMVCTQFIIPELTMYWACNRSVHHPLSPVFPQLPTKLTRLPKESTINTVDCLSNPPGGGSAVSAPVNPTPSTTMSSVPSLQPAVLSGSTTTTAKHTVTGKYKAAKAVYTEPGDLDEWSDGGSKLSHDHQVKQQRTTITTRSRSNISSAGSPPTNGPAASNLPATPSLDRSPPSIDEPVPLTKTPSAEKEAPRVTPSESSPSMSTTETSPAVPTVNFLVDTSTLRRSPSPKTVTPSAATKPTLEKDGSPHTTSRETPSITHNAQLAVIPEIPLLAPAMIPKFLSIAQKKSKTSVYSYLLTSPDHHFHSLLQVYICFESAAVSWTGSLLTTNCPTQIPCWIRSAHTDAPPEWSNLKDYGMSVIKWWSSLQPSWRALSNASGNWVSMVSWTLWSSNTGGVMASSPPLTLVAKKRGTVGLWVMFCGCCWSSSKSICLESRTSFWNFLHVIFPVQPIMVYSMLDLLAMKLRGQNGSKPFN